MTFKIYFKNIDTNEDIQKPMTVNGAVGESYQVKKMIFDQYRLIEQTAPLSGVYSNNDQDITLFYRRRDWVEGQKTRLKIQLFEDTSIYTDTDVDSKKKTAKAESTYEIIMRVVTPDGSFWYRTEDGNWIRYDGTTMELLDSDIADEPESEAPKEKPKAKAKEETKKEDIKVETTPKVETEVKPASINVSESAKASSDSKKASNKTADKKETASKIVVKNVVIPDISSNKKTVSKEEAISEIISTPKKKLRKDSEFNAKIDFVPNKYTAVFELPYGVAVDKIRHDTKVKIINRIDEPGGITWFKLDNKGWITSLYVKGI